MYTSPAVTTIRSVIGATILGCTLFAGIVAADDQPVTVAMHVTSRGLDLTQPAGAREFYARLKYAARVVCTRADRVGLAPEPDVHGCYEKALGDGIRSAGAPQVTQIYLETHTLREAAARGIDVPARVATK